MMQNVMLCIIFVYPADFESPAPVQKLPDVRVRVRVRARVGES